jgi:hypothetical protein
LLSAACGTSTSFQQAALREHLAGKAPEINDDEVARALALRPQLPKPFRLGVFFRDAETLGAQPAWRWDLAQKQRVLAATAALRERGEAGDVFMIDDAVVAHDDLPAIRLAAARHGADAVLVVSGIDDARRSENGWAAAYVVIAPVLFAPGSDLRETFMVSAELWDVRNEYLYMAAQAEAESHQRRPLCWIDREEAARAAQLDAVGQLGTELSARFKTM